MAQTLADRYALAMAVFFGGMGAMSIDFGLIVAQGGSPITPETYGPSVYVIPALAWVVIQLGASLLGFMGSLHRSLAGDVALFVGAIASLFLYSAFAYMALSAPQGSLLAAGSRSFVCPCCFFAAYVSGASIYARWK